jgi:signal transduction histidine kinase/HPt (histidine-containing phosphotransfer) domain-containing protein
MSRPLAGATKADRDAAGDAEIFAARIDLLYGRTHRHLFLPFSALCIAASLYSRIASPGIVVLPFLLQVAATVAAGQLTRAYRRRSPSDDPAMWANRHIIVSAAAGAAWGVGAIIWFVPHNFPQQAFLVLAFLGMTATDFIANSAFRPSYGAHACCSLVPLALMLMLEGNLYASCSGVLLIFFAGVLWTFGEGIAAELDESLRLKRTNIALVESLSREKKEAELARDLAEANARSKSAFVANVSHEIRTPLNALLGMAQLLERSELDRNQKSHVKVLLEAGRGLKTLLDDVTALSREDGEGEPRSEEDCDAEQAARTVVRLLQARAWEKQLRLTVSAAAHLPRVAADPRRVRQVLLKLADNALKFTQAGSIDIAVDAETTEQGVQCVRFSVTDTGLGVPSDIASHIFEPFPAADTSYARRLEGTGLGLAVAKRAITLLGGAIGFESEPGEGSVFWFTLPTVRPADGQERELVAVAGDTTPPWGLKILVWTSDEAVRSALTQLLEPFGNRLELVESATEAVASCSRDGIDAVIVDASDADSVAAAPGLRASVLALIQTGMRAPTVADRHLRWPAGAGELYHALREMLGRAADTGAGIDESGPVAAIDAAAFAALEKSLGVSTLIEILKSYIATAESLASALETAVASHNWDDAARIAQDIAGSAGGLGLAGLMAAARGFAQKVREGGADPSLKDAAEFITAEHARVCKALANLYPELASAA